MATDDVRGLLGEADRLKARARADQRRSSVPLLVFGALVVGYGPVSASTPGLPGLYWLVAGPGALATIWWWRGRHARRIGAGPGRGPYGRTAVALALVLFVALPVLFLLPTAAVALMLLIVAWRQHNGYLAGGAVVLGVVGGLEDLAFFDNRLYDLARLLGLFAEQEGYFRGAPVIVYGLLGLALVLAGLRARRLESR